MEQIKLKSYTIKKIAYTDNISDDVNEEFELEHKIGAKWNYSVERKLWVFELIYQAQTNPKADFSIEIVIEGSFLGEISIPDSVVCQEAALALIPYIQTGVSLLTTYASLPPIILPDISPDQLSELLN